MVTQAVSVHPSLTILHRTENNETPQCKQLQRQWMQATGQNGHFVYCFVLGIQQEQILIGLQQAELGIQWWGLTIRVKWKRQHCSNIAAMRRLQRDWLRMVALSTWINLSGINHSYESATAWHHLDFPSGPVQVELKCSIALEIVQLTWLVEQARIIKTEERPKVSF